MVPVVLFSSLLGADFFSLFFTSGQDKEKGSGLYLAYFVTEESKKAQDAVSKCLCLSGGSINHITALHSEKRQRRK